jgi:archaetidylinositol phosphate synthase
MLENLRPYLNKILNPIAKKIDINPNYITILSIIISILVALLFYFHQLILGGIFIFISGSLDVLDGAVARYHNKSSKFGAFLDSTTDRFSDAIIIIGLISGGYIDWFIGILAIHSAYTISYIRSKAESMNIECKVGIAERAIRLVILIIAVLIGGIVDNTWLKWIVILLIILSYFTVIQRMVYTWNKLKSKDSSINNANK